MAEDKIFEISERVTVVETQVQAMKEDISFALSRVGENQRLINKVLQKQAESNGLIEGKAKTTNYLIMVLGLVISGIALIPTLA